LNIINKLRQDGHRILFITSCTKYSAGRKLEWLQKWGYLEKSHHCPDYIECGEKTLINVDVMIDDRFSTIENFAKLGKLPILFIQPWNKDTIYSNPNVNIKRVESFNEIYTIITEYSNKKEVHKFVEPTKSTVEWNYDLTKGGVKEDRGKVRWGLLSYPALNEIAKVMTFGSMKYKPYNWAAGLNYTRVFDSLMRHITSWYNGENNDGETGLPHLAHAGCCVMFLLSYELWGMKEFDDRFIKDKK